MRTQLLVVPAAIAATLLIAGCVENDHPVSQKEVSDLRSSMAEQANRIADTNERVGALENRVGDVEDRLAGPNVIAESETEVIEKIKEYATPLRELQGQVNEAGSLTAFLDNHSGKRADYAARVAEICAGSSELYRCFLRTLGQAFVAVFTPEFAKPYYSCYQQSSVCGNEPTGVVEDAYDEEVEAVAFNIQRTVADAAGGLISSPTFIRVTCMVACDRWVEEMTSSERIAVQALVERMLTLHGKVVSTSDFASLMAEYTAEEQVFKTEGYNTDGDAYARMQEIKAGLMGTLPGYSWDDLRAANRHVVPNPDGSKKALEAVKTALAQARPMDNTRPSTERLENDG